jgi:hypothetical protein
MCLFSFLPLKKATPNQMKSESIILTLRSDYPAPGVTALSVKTCLLSSPPPSCSSTSLRCPRSSPGTLTCVRATWSSTSSTPSGPRSPPARSPRGPTASPRPPGTTCSSSTSPGPWARTTAGWSPPSPARRARAYR